MTDKPETSETAADLIRQAIQTPIVSNDYDRTTLNFQACFEQHGEPIVSEQITHCYSRKASEHDVYTRRMMVTPEWAPVDVGWLSTQDIALLILQNRAERLSVNPSAEVLEQITNRVIEVTFDGSTPHALVRSGGFIALEPVLASRIHIRSRTGSWKIRVTATPG